LRINFHLIEENYTYGNSVIRFISIYIAGNDIAGDSSSSFIPLHNIELFTMWKVLYQQNEHGIFPWGEYPR